MKNSKLITLLKLEKAATEAFASLSPVEKRVYAIANPRSVIVATYPPHVKKGALHKQEGKPANEKFTESELENLKEHGTPLEKKRANFAINFRHHK